VGDGVFEPQDAGDAVSAKKMECLVADREAVDGHGGAEEGRMDLWRQDSIIKKRWRSGSGGAVT